LYEIQQRYEGKKLFSIESYSLSYLGFCSAQPISSTIKAKKKAYRANQSAEAREKRLTRDAARHREYYKNESEEQRTLRKARDAARHRETYLKKKAKYV